MKNRDRNGTMIDVDAEDFSHGAVLEPYDNILNPWRFSVESQQQAVIRMWEDPPICCPGQVRGLCLDEKNCPHKIGEFKWTGIVAGIKEVQLFVHICFYADWIKRRSFFIKRTFDKPRLIQVFKMENIDFKDPKFTGPIPFGVPVSELS